MAFPHFIITLVFALALARIGPTSCQMVEGKVSCTDCTQSYDFSGIKVSVKCEGVKKVAVTSTEENGFFKVDLPSDHTKPASMKCLAKLLGGPNQLYASRKDPVSQIVKAKDNINTNSYTIFTPLSFSKSCPQNKDCNFGSSKTINLPVPPEWGLAPSSYYYFPFLPIIGIP